MKIYIIFWIVFISLFFSSPSRAESPTIQNIRISNSPSHLNIRFYLANSFSSKIEEAIKNGIPTTFTYSVMLYRHSFWNDKFLTAITLVKTIKFDNLKNECTILSAIKEIENSTSSLVVPTLEEAKKNMNQVEIFSVYPIWKLERNNTYYFKIKAAAEGVKPPPYIHYFLFFLDWKYFDTDWVIENFRY
jgi:hypothetical protein